MYNASNNGSHAKIFDETKCRSFLIKDDELSEKWNKKIKSRIKSTILFKKNLTVNQYTMKNM